MTFFMMLSIKLLSILMMLLSALSVISYQICGNNYHCLLGLNLSCETLKSEAGRGFLISILKRLSFICLTSVITLFAIDVKMNLPAKKKLSFEYTEVAFPLSTGLRLFYCLYF